jgi:hypothetical protein
MLKNCYQEIALFYSYRVTALKQPPLLSEYSTALLYSCLVWSAPRPAVPLHPPSQLPTKTKNSLDYFVGYLFAIALLARNSNSGPIALYQHHVPQE